MQYAIIYAMLKYMKLVGFFKAIIIIDCIYCLVLVNFVVMCHGLIPSNKIKFQNRQARKTHIKANKTNKNKLININKTRDTERNNIKLYFDA